MGNYTALQEYSMLKYVLSSTIKYKLLCLYALLVILPLTTATLVISYALSKTAAKDASEYIISNLKSVSENINGRLKMLDFIHTPMLSNESFVSELKQLKTRENRVTYSDYFTLTHIHDFLAANHINNINNSNFHSIYLYSSLGKTFFSTAGLTRIINDYEIQDALWFRDYKSLPPYKRWVISSSNEDNTQIICSVKEIRSYPEDTPLGFISVNVSESAVVNLLQKIKFKTTGFSFVADKQGNIISGTDNKDNISFNSIMDTISAVPEYGYFKAEVNSSKSLVAYYNDDYTGWTYIAVTPLKEINTAAVIIRYYSIFIYVFIIVLFLIAVFLAYVYLYSPINRLFSAMKKLEYGDFNVQLDGSRQDEIGYINKNFNSMVESLRKLIQENYISKLLEKDAQLKSVLSKINEHFLYNTLDSLHWAARKYNVPQISRIVFSLSKFYRLSLSNGADVIPVREVLNIINCYIDIQKFRLQESLRYECEVDDWVLEENVLKYLFQPLVENAVVHGIEKKSGGGRIKVSLKDVDKKLRFKVEDDGVGINSERLERISAQLASENEYTDDNFALKNINIQMKLFYSPECELHIESVEGEGTTVWFDIPMLCKKEEGYHGEIIDN